MKSHRHYGTESFDAENSQGGTTGGQQQQQDHEPRTPDSSYGATKQKAIVVDGTRLTGRCLWFDSRKNYGAIQPDISLGIEAETGHSYIFVHGNDLESGSQPPKIGDTVEFCRGTCPRGRTKAAKVVVIASAPSQQAQQQVSATISSSTQQQQQQQQAQAQAQAQAAAGYHYVTGAHMSAHRASHQMWAAGSTGSPANSVTPGTATSSMHRQSAAVQQQQQAARNASTASPTTYPGGSTPYGAPGASPYSPQQQAAYAQQYAYVNGHHRSGYGAPTASQVYGPPQQHATHPGVPPGVATATVPQRSLGRVKWFDRDRKSYGFITPADGSPDLFMHAGDVIGSTKTLGPGDAVEFDYGVQPQSGRPKALEVVRLVQHVVSDEDEDDGRTTIGTFAPGDEPLFDKARITGTISRYDTTHRWGFIAPDDANLKPPNGGDNFFVHGLDVLDATEESDVHVGQRVAFAVVRTRSRRCKAVQVLRLPPGQQVPIEDGTENLTNVGDEEDDIIENDEQADASVPDNLMRANPDDSRRPTETGAQTGTEAATNNAATTATGTAKPDADE